MNHFEKFTINNVSKRLNKINPESSSGQALKISLSHQKPFPKLHLLSNYQFKKRFVKVFPDGNLQGGYARMITSLIDFSFIRSLVAHCYAVFGPPCYDPVSLFLLDLFRYIDGYQDMSRFLPLVHDQDQGRGYRTYAGISTDNIPCEATFSNFRFRIGENLYNEIFHILVDIFHQLEIITFKILAHDGTLYPTWACYKGCTYFCKECHCITVNDVINKVRNRILYRLNNLSKSTLLVRRRRTNKLWGKNNLGSECRVYTDCPSDRFPDDVKRPKVELFAFKLTFNDGEPTQEQKNTATLFGVKEELDKQNLCISTLRSNVSKLNPDDDSFTISCPKLPKDTDARIGVRRNPQNPDKKQKIFGYNAVLSTSVELHLGVELPVAITNIAGNADEDKQLIANKDQIHNHHHTTAKIDILDVKYDTMDNFQYIRDNRSIPIIDYNPRNENLSKKTLLDRGYDQNGWPFAPCGLLTRPNGFDQKHGRLTFCCFKQCLNLKYKALEELHANYNIDSCPHIHSKTGYDKHMYIKEHPRLINEIPRGSKRYNTVKKLRSASERANSSLKEDLKILEKPRILGKTRANIRAQLAAITLLLRRTFTFIVKITNLIRTSQQANDPHIKKNLNPPYIPKSILNIIQIE